MIGSLIGLFYENSILENNNAQIKLGFFENISLDLIGIGIIIIFSIKVILYYYSNKNINYFVTNTLYFFENLYLFNHKHTSIKIDDKIK